MERKIIDSDKTRCPACGEVQHHDAEVCSSCGTMLNPINSCVKCGAKLLPGQQFCSSCGQSVSLDLATVKKPNKKLLVGVAAGAVFLVALAIVLFAFVLPVKSLDLSKSELKLAPKEQETLQYEIYPNYAIGKAVEWSSSDENVAKVIDGEITAVAPGRAVIALTSRNGKTASCDVEVDGADLEAIFMKLDTPDLGGSIVLAKDHSYIEFDTNSFDIEDWHDEIVWEGIEEAVKELNLPSSVVNEISRTRALDGRMSETFDYVSLSWSYHPDSGLNLIIKKNALN